MDSLIVTQPMQWSSAPDIADVEPLSESDKHCLRDLRDTLARHDALGRFGISLIHRHFDIAEDECLVERIDIENRILTVSPVKKGAVGDAIATHWRLAEGDAYIVCDQQCVYQDGHANRHYNRPGIAAS